MEPPSHEPMALLDNRNQLINHHRGWSSRQVYDSVGDSSSMCRYVSAGVQSCAISNVLQLDLMDRSKARVGMAAALAMACFPIAVWASPSGKLEDVKCNIQPEGVGAILSLNQRQNKTCRVSHQYISRGSGMLTTILKPSGDELKLTMSPTARPNEPYQDQDGGYWVRGWAWGWDDSGSRIETFANTETNEFIILRYE